MDAESVRREMAARYRFLMAALMGAAVLPLWGGFTAAAVTTVDLAGQQAVGQAAGVKYWSVGTAVFSPNGTLAFTAGVGTKSTGPLTSVGYIGQPVGYQVFAKQGDPLPSAGAGDTITTPQFSSISNAGVGVGLDVFSGSNAGVYSSAVCVGNASSFTAIAAPGQTAPAGGAYSGLFQNPVISADGQVAFAGEVTSAPGGVFVYAHQTTTAVAIGGAAAPGLPYSFYQFNSSPNISDGGVVSFVATTGGPGNLGPIGMWNGKAGALNLVASTGGAAPGAPSGAAFGTFDTRVPAVNRAGQLAFRGHIGGGSVNSTSDTGIWTTLSGSLGLVAREGSQAPGMPAGVKYGDFGGGQSTNDPVLNNGMIAFPAALTGSTVTGAIFGGAPGALSPLVLAGQPVAGLPASISTVDFYDLDMNSSGQLVFYADLAGPNLNQFDSQAILSYDPLLGVSLVAWGGQPIAGTNITPYNGAVLNGGTGVDHPHVLSDGGLVVFTSFGSPGNQIVVTAVPEAGSLLWLGAGGLIALTGRRSRSSVSCCT
ncbi:MAG: DUF7453 family protein [Phycisphaerae bacterium]